jgi:hypothetical protein
MCAKIVKKTSKSPRSLYFEAKRKNERSPEETLIAKPYNYKLKKFVSRREEYEASMFLFGMAYLRNVLKRFPEIHKKQYREILEKQLLKHFDSFSVYDYACFLDSKLPPELHQRMVLESFTSSDTWIKAYLENLSARNPRKGRNGILSKTDEIYNYLLDNPTVEPTQIIKDLWKKGIKVTKSMITKIKKQMTNETIH